MRSPRIAGLLLIALALLGLGMGQLSDGNEVFALSRLPCCNNGIDCESEVLGLDCSSDVSAHVKPDWCSTSMTITCEECVDYKISGCLCQGGSNFCWDGGDKYYGTYTNCPPAKK